MWNNLGIISLRLGKYKEAIESIEKSLELDPKNANSLASLGEVQEEKEEFEKAIEYYKKAIELNPNNNS